MNEYYVEVVDRREDDTEEVKVDFYRYSTSVYPVVKEAYKNAEKGDVIIIKETSSGVVWETEAITDGKDWN